MLTRRQLRYGAGLLLGIAGLGLGLFLLQKPVLLADVDYSRAVFDRNGKLLQLTLTRDEQYRLFTPLAQISPQLCQAVLLHEDQHFYNHPGINPVALVRAFAATYLGGARRMGASTITMQLARLTAHLNSRSIHGKLVQMLYALRLELHYSKDELLEAYLNRAPYGGNIEGVGAASLVYYRTQPIALSLPQALTLAVIPQSPARRQPEAARPDKPALIAARNRLFARWQAEYPVSETQALFFKLPLVSSSRRDLPRLAPHLTRDLLQHYSAPQISATIESGLQRRLETLLQDYVRDKRDLGINNASALLINTRSMAVLASIGSADFSNPAINGQVDGTRAKRSPGSALKPFIYALAFDQGLVHPQSILADTPTGFGSYQPDNFERDFRGPISAFDALRFSRNIPAIKLAAQLRQPSYYTFLQRAGISKLRRESDYGLSLVLGGAEVTAREMAGLYAMLANGGVQRPLRFQTTVAEPEARQQLLSPEASFMALDILSHSPHPLRSEDDGTIAWKTGTSNGLHDAWTAGVFGDYALVVWVGNFSGKSNPALVGVRSAAPLFFAIADALRDGAVRYPAIATRAKGLNVRQVPVCATTGALDTAGCNSIAQSWFIPGISPMRGASIMRPLLINLQTGKQACHFVPGITVYRNVEVWPSDLQQVMRLAGLMKPPVPPLEPGCTRAEEGGTAPVILSPLAHITYQARPNGAGEAVLLKASADGAVQSLHWFINNRYFGQSRPEDSLSWNPTPGHYALRVVDDAGHSASIEIAVTLAPF